ncbi:MAG: MFS transporter [Phycisphaerae bacterium]
MNRENESTSVLESSSNAPADSPAAAHSTSFDDVKQLGFFAAIGSLSYVFWIVGGMEMVERLAFYGVKAVATLYAKDPVSSGGLGVNMTAFGVITATWAFVQCFVPIFTGGLSDRYGYKETIFASTIVKILGYLIMAWFPTYWGFFAGVIVLAIGTAIFKPGIQGTLIKSTDRRNSSIAWGIFYQTVNIGGFLGPLVAGYMRKMEWTYVFYSCAVIISLNFLLLLTYREVGKEERLARQRAEATGGIARRSLFSESLTELAKPHVWTYLLLFSGFWFMFNSLFDVLPAHIDDWVDSSDVVRALNPSGQSGNPIVNFFVIVSEDGTHVQPEGMVNVNAGLIMTTCFIFAGLSACMRATTSMFVGTLLAAIGLFGCGYATLGWMSLGAIAIFSVGEMLSSPKFSEFIGNFAPHDKKAMYIGFSQIPIAIGWTLEGQLGLTMYEHMASKDRFSRDLMVDWIRGGKIELPTLDALTTLAGSHAAQNPPEKLAEWFRLDPGQFASAIPQGEAFQWLVTISHQTPQALTSLLYSTHNVGLLWYIMGGIGVASAIGIWIYGQWIRTLKPAA